MGYIDNMCYKVACKIIENIFWVKYEPTIKDNKTWYENVNDFIVKEYLHLKINAKVDAKVDEEDDDMLMMLPFSDKETYMIILDAMDILLDKLESYARTNSRQQWKAIDGGQFNEFENEIDWSKFSDIIGYYIYMIIEKDKQSIEISAGDNNIEHNRNQCIICKTCYSYVTITNDGNTIDYCYECYCEKK